MYLLTLIRLESWNHTIKEMKEVSFGKNNSGLYHVRKIARLDWSKSAKQFSVNSRRKLLFYYCPYSFQGTFLQLNLLQLPINELKQNSKQVDSSFPLSDKYFSVFWVVISAKYVVLFILEKCLLHSYSYLWYLLEFGSTIFMYHGKTFRRHVSFSIS